MIRNQYYNFSFLIIFFFVLTGCTSNLINESEESLANTSKDNVLYIYQDGKIKFRERLLNQEDVIIYNDGRGGEKAAIKMRVPRYPDYYRDSIVVVRVESDYETKKVPN